MLAQKVKYCILPLQSHKTGQYILLHHPLEQPTKPRRDTFIYNNNNYNNIN